LIKTKHIVFVVTTVFLFGCDLRQGKRAQAKIESKSKTLQILDAKKLLEKIKLF